MSDKVKVVNPFLFPFAKVWYHAVQMPVYKLKRWWHRLNYIEGISGVGNPAAQFAGQNEIATVLPPIHAKINHAGNELTQKPFNQQTVTFMDGLQFVAGIQPDGIPLIVDLTHAPHTLMAGGTGSGKSVLIHSILRQLISRYSRELLNLVLIDPKCAELVFYAGAPQLIQPIATDAESASKLLDFVIGKMDERNALFSKHGCRDIARWNKKHPDKLMPRILVVVDEFADIILTDEYGFEDKVTRIAAKARSAGIHMILCTQRPDSKVVNGRIKANFSGRICLKVSNSLNSRIVIDEDGGEKLRGRGDMLVFNGSELKRCQGFNVTDDDLEDMAYELSKLKSLCYNKFLTKKE
jgi:S-DNA-T family DNA segregation ATPase FtsK/SpoIIIE